MILNAWDDFVQTLKDFFISIGNFFMQKNEYGMNMLSRIIIAIVVLILGHFLIKGFIGLLRKTSGIKKGLAVDLSLKSFFFTTLKIVLYFVLAFSVVGILGLDVSGGVGVVSAVTVALGLALQDIIGMFASGILIFHAHNFKTGDYIKVVNSFGEEEGFVDRINLLYTTLRNVSGQKIHIPNNNMTKANVTNFAANTFRRGVISLFITFEASSKDVIDTLLEAAKEDKRVLDDPQSSAVIGDFKEFGVQYDLRFFTSIDDYWDTLFDLRVACLNKLKEKGITIAKSNVITIKEKKVD